MTIKNRIKEYLSSQNKKLTMQELAQELSLNSSADYKKLAQAINRMEREGAVVYNSKGKISLGQSQLSIRGIFRANERGFGFVSIDEEEDDVYIAKENTHFALDGDLVEVAITQPALPLKGKGAEGSIVAVKERKLTQIVGNFHAYSDEEVEKSGLYGYVLPKNKKLSSYIVLVSAVGIRPVSGAVVIVEIKHYPEEAYPDQLEGLVTKVIGYVNDVGMDILEIVYSNGITPEFREATLKMADEVPDKPSEKDYIGRRDLREQTIVTIDGADAKDLDDAVCVWQKENGNYHLGVHIADVSYYVTEHSAIDEEAHERGTSVYLTDRVIPMIPQRLSNGICSLNPHVPRLTMTCEMEIDKTGDVVFYEIFPSVIQTTERMTYDAVNQIIDDENAKTMERYKTCVPMFQQMKTLHHLLEKMRLKRGAIQFESAEAKILVDEEGKPQDILLRTRATAEKMIESFMLVANETVAKHFSEKNLPFLFRIHEHPKSDKLERFFDFASVFGIAIKGTTEKLEQTELQNILEQVAKEPYEMVINTMLLRSMQQAKYSEQNAGHYGLAASFYTHFTSPIRRYPDLVVHRLIREYQQSTSVKRQTKWAKQLPEIAEHTSQMERRAITCEREVDTMKKCEFLQQHIGEEFEGIISSVAKFGFFVELPNTIEGLIHVNELKEDYFQYIEKHMALVGERTGQVFKLGQKVIIKVEKADPETREIDFSFVSTNETQAVGNALKRETARVIAKEKKQGNRKERRNPRKKEKQKMTSDSSSKKEFGKNFQKKKKKKAKPFYKKIANKKRSR